MVEKSGTYTWATKTKWLCVYTGQRYAAIVKWSEVYGSHRVRTMNVVLDMYEL